MCKDLLEYLAEKICSLSQRYTATIPDMPRKYCRTNSIQSADCLSIRYKRGILIERKRNAFVLHLPKKAFVFEPDLENKVRRMARCDASFSARLAAMELNSDDIELIISDLTYGLIQLHLRGRKVFREDNEDV